MMYRLIVSEKIKYPKHVSAESREIISKLMTKNPDRRLGSVSDAEEVMDQTFFAPINWSDLKKKRITPPFKPEVSDTDSFLNLEFILTFLSWLMRWTHRMLIRSSWMTTSP